MWYAIIGALCVVSLCGILFISFRAANFDFIQKLCRGRRWLGRLICFIFVCALFAATYFTLNMWNALVITVHFALFWAIGDLIALLVRRYFTRRRRRRYIAGAASSALCVIYLAYGWIMAHHVFITGYAFESEKLDGDLRIVQISDSHIGATFHADGFAGYMREINGLSPDVVAVTGDFVDDDTSRSDMIGACDALGKLNAKYGVYFVFGNHDKGYFSAESRGWTEEELRQSLEDAGVVILEDESVLIDNRFYVVGRIDRSASGSGARMTASQLTSKLDKSKFILMLDHQPADFDAEADSGADLVLCGHTHGGQFIPVNHVGEWMGENCLRYGHERRGNTDFIVSSGIANWTFKFKTGCYSEYVVIDLTEK